MIATRQELIRALYERVGRWQAKDSRARAWAPGAPARLPPYGYRVGLSAIHGLGRPRHPGYAFGRCGLERTDQEIDEGGDSPTRRNANNYFRQ
jgi:hypothetical protein